jgi:flagellar biosynthesis/type III secretory pathway chaperone
MDGHPASTTAIRQILAHAQEALDLLRGYLREEIERLGDGNTEGLATLLNDKLAALKALEHYEAERRSIVSDAGFDCDAAGMRSYLTAQNDPDLNEDWDHLTASLQELQALNEANGAAISRTLQRVTRQLSLLTGKSNESVSQTYDPKGKHRPGGSGGREISRA